MNDNVYPLDGQYFAPVVPQKQAEERKREINETLDQLPLLKQVIKRLDKQIAQLDTLSSIQADIKDDPATFQKIFEANKLAKAVLAGERSYIMARIERTTKR